MRTDDEGMADQLYTTEEVADFLGVSARKVLMMPIKQIKLGPRLIRFRLEDVYDFLELENPN